MTQKHKSLTAILLAMLIVITCATSAIAVQPEPDIKTNAQSEETAGPKVQVIPTGNSAQDSQTDAGKKSTEPVLIHMGLNYNGFELPPNGATGYAVSAVTMRYDKTKHVLATIPAGSMFIIRADDGKYLKVTYDGTTGYINKNLAMINLPDVLPSIKYIDSNGTASLFKSSGKALENVTGQQLYTGKTYNKRLDRNEFNMPVMYTTAQKIARVQQAAMLDGNCLMIYESYRPMAVQKLVNTSLSALIKSDKTVNKNINDGRWGQSWFIAKSRSNHQLGVAIDVSLGRINSIKELAIADIRLNIPDEVQELDMPTAMHELSNKAAALAYGVDSKSSTAWMNAPFASTMTDAAKTMRGYFTNQKMTPLASEWWHFNDLPTRKTLLALASPNGGFEITGNCSVVWNTIA